MKLALLLLAACTAPVRPVSSSPVRAASGMEWLEGRWHSAQLDATWMTIGGVLWGAAINDGGFEVNYIAHGALTSLENGDKPQTFALHKVTNDQIVFDQVTVTRTPGGWRGEFAAPGKPIVAFDMTPAPATHVDDLERADREFAADTQRDGVEGWVKHFDEHGAMWRKDHRVEGLDDVRTSAAKTLGAGELRWDPVASGARGDLGFTLGAATFTEPGARPTPLTYCTIWKHEPDGSWKVLFDIGRPAE